jgi:ankyrin repeat protein
MAPLIKINDVNKNILLMNAAEQGIPGLVQYAINKKANLDYVKEDGRTPLSAATQENNYLCCRYLLQAGANVNMPFNDNNPLAYRPIDIATRNSFFNITKLLIKFKATINEECYFCHKKPIEHLLVDKWRSKSKCAPILKLLIDHGATIPKEYIEKAEEILTLLK